ncbi:hypothetical protein RHGRI_009034 [Rhododendron griersonianum]|uniref:Uncharacterized protein n=1 Tax=Rhododendron griersonianum TaxID=479676 RepID=A0AAV6L3X3_9ERIC|nr:hypothetical protein RHGRI_009034 [Rhododendron griersonianum]
MKGTSKVIMGATLVMLAILATVLGLVLVLLAELYCSMLLRRRRKPTPSTAAATASNTPANDSSSSPSHPVQDQILSPKPLRTFYAHGVLDAPRSFLYPAVVHGEEYTAVDVEKQQHTQQPPTAAAWSPPLSPPFIISLTPPNPVDKINPMYDEDGGEHLVYICNPIYDEDGGRGSRLDTPFETPDTSPSRLGDDGFPGEGSSLASSSPDSWVVASTPPLSPMKKLPEEGCSVSLKDARSLATSSDSNSNSDSSSASPCTSPSW